MNQFMANLRRDHIALIRHCQAMVVKCKVLYKQHEARARKRSPQDPVARVAIAMTHAMWVVFTPPGHRAHASRGRVARSRCQPSQSPSAPPDVFERGLTSIRLASSRPPSVIAVLRSQVDAQLKQLYLEPLLRSRCGALLVAVVEGKLRRRVLPEVSSVLPRKLKKRNSVKVWDQFMDDVQNVRQGSAATVTAGFGGAAAIARRSVGEAIRTSKPGSVRPGTKDDSTMDLTAEAELSEVVRRRSADEMALAQMATASALELEKDTSSDVTMDTVVEMVTPAETARSAHEAGATDEAAATKPPMEVEDMS
jgi:hypothetical protein